MRHPFDGVLLEASISAPGAEEPCVEPATPDRRAVLGSLAAVAASLLGIGKVGAVDLEANTTRAGEQGAQVPVPVPPPVATTLAVGEEGATQGFKQPEAGGTEARNEAGVTTAPKVNHTRALNETGEAGEAGNLGVKPGSVDVSKKDMEAAWKELGDSDPNKSNKSIRTLVSAKDGFSFMKDNLKAEKTVDSTKVEPLIKDLGSDKFDARESASAELKKFGPPAMPLIGDYLDKKKYGSDMEVKKRLEEVSSKIQESPAMQQGLRGLEVLLLMGSKESRELLEGFAKADPKTWLSGPADGVLKRVAKK